jgi:hypothetical protein
MKAVVIFGTTESSLYRPLGPKVTVINAAKSFARYPSKKQQQKVLKAVLE